MKTSDLNDKQMKKTEKPQKNARGFYQLEYDPTIDRSGFPDQCGYQYCCRQVRYGVYEAKQSLGSRYYEVLDAFQDDLEMQLYNHAVDVRTKKTFHKQGNDEEREAACKEQSEILDWCYVLHVLAETKGDSSSKAFVNWLGRPYCTCYDHVAFEKAERLRAEWDSILG